MGLSTLFPPQVQLAIAAVGLAATAAGGAWAWHHTPLIGPGAVIRRLQGQLGKATNTIADQAQRIAVDQAAIAERDTALAANGSTAAAEANQAGQFWRGQCRAAFEAGYASNSCKGGADGAAGPQSGPGGVRPDLRTLWQRGAYPGPAGPAAPGVPAQP